MSPTLHDSYLICATPRTGSTLLCSLLKSTGEAGAPESFYHHSSISEWAKDWRLPRETDVPAPDFNRSYLEAARREGTATSNIFAKRLMRHSFDDLAARLKTIFPDLPNDKAVFNAAFGRTFYIHLSREDKISQAVSLVKAEQSGLWHVAADGTELERTAPPQLLKYDANQIGKQLAEVRRADIEWINWFEQQGNTPLRITYEALATDPRAVMATILKALGLDEKLATKITPAVAKLADDVSAEWVRKYRAEDQSS
jgi:trehalose 2-sulfotransferase